MRRAALMSVEEAIAALLALAEEHRLHDSEPVLLAVEPLLIGNGFDEVITKAYYSAEEAQIVSETTGSPA